MAPRTETFDLGALALSSGEGRRLELEVAIGSFELSAERYACEPALVPVTLDVARMTGQGFSLRLRFGAELAGPCMRCLEPAAVRVDVDAREIDQPGGGEDLDSPYVTGEVLDLAGWAHDAFALAAPVQVLCRPDCAGLCPVCAANLNETGSEHSHEPEPDPRWAKLRELKLD